MSRFRRALSALAVFAAALGLTLTSVAPAGADVTTAAAPGLQFVNTNFPNLPQTVSSTVPVRVEWRPVAGSSPCDYAVYRSLNGSGFSYLLTTSDRSITQRIAPNNRVQYLVYAIDCNGNYGPGEYGNSAYVRLDGDNSASYYGPNWSLVRSSSALGGSYRQNSRNGSYAYYYNCYYNVAWVATKSPQGGTAAVYVDGVFAGSVNLYSPTVRYREIVFKTYDADSSCHSIQIRNTSSSSTRNRLSIDGFARLEA